MEKLGSYRVVGLAVITAAAFWAHDASAVPISASFAYQFLDNVSPNSVGLNAGGRQQLGANCVVPTGTACFPQAAGAPFGTTGVATQGAVTLPLNFVASDLTSNHFAVSRPPAAIPDGAWTLTFSNGPNTAVTQTPTLGATTAPGFVSSASISGSGATPTFSWTLPAGQPIDAISVNIRDLTDFRGTGGVGGSGIATIIYHNTFSPTTTSFTVLPNDPRFLQGRTLEPGRQYSLEIQLQDTRNNLPMGGFANVERQSRSFLDFGLLPANAPPTVFLPMIDTSGPVPVHRFQPIPVVAGQLIFIDPLIAIGYDYQTGLGDPAFRSMLLPTDIGDNLFDLWLWSGVDWFDTGTDLFGGVEFLFGPGGVDRFRITGIEVDELVDPFSTTEFITGVSFVANGFFSGTMTPLVVNVAQVPEPSSFRLMLAGLLMIGFIARRRNSASYS